MSNEGDGLKVLGTVWTMTRGEDGVPRGESTAAATFPIRVERHNREAFQKAGHFVTRMIDEQQHPREWQGEDVYIGEVFNIREDLEGTVTRNRLLRVMADSPEELLRLIDLRIRESYFAFWLAQQVPANRLIELEKENAVLQFAMKDLKQIFAIVEEKAKNFEALSQEFKQQVEETQKELRETREQLREALAKKAPGKRK